MALALEIEYLGGVYFAAIGPDCAEPDWPPQPDRIYSALVATWGAHEEPPEERAALEWLEMQPAPVCDATDGEARTTPAVFVPPNDPRVDKAKNAVGVLPALRSRHPRRFPAARPHNPVLRYVWHDEPEERTLAALDQLARDTAYVGHSASLTRCRFTLLESVPMEASREPKRGVYPGRLKELSEGYKHFLQSADKKDRPRAGVLVAARSQAQERHCNVFSNRWLILEHVSGEMPDFRASAIVARGVRTALMSGYGQIGALIPASISGHETDGSPARAPHMAVVPLSFTGFPHADGRLLGFALVSPNDIDLLEDETFRKVLRKLAPLNEGYGRRVLEVKSAQGTAENRSFAIGFSPSFEMSPGLRSLDPAIYTRPAHRFATVTPIVLDRYLKRQGEARMEEISKQIAAACERIGLPRPVAVFPGKHSALQGAVSAYPSGHGPAWLNWRLPDSLAGRQLTHAVIEFAKPVEGPVLIGAGRFVGMGLCRPLGGEKR
jgi:CRISPR-associated protein Csb2